MYKMKERSIYILIAMMAVVLITSAYGAYRDGDGDDDNKESQRKGRNLDVVNKTIDTSSDVIGASGAGTSYKTAKTHLDTSARANGPYVDEGPNVYKGKASGYNLDNDSDSDSDSDSNSDSNSDSDSESNGGESKSNGGDSKSNGGYNDTKSSESKVKYIIKSISKLFKEIFSKWGNQGTIMAPSGMEEMNPDVLSTNTTTVEGLRIREKFKKSVKSGMRNIKDAFGGRRRR